MAMERSIWGRLLHLFGWEVCITVPRRSKCVICVAPHTSNWDFILGLAAYKSLGREANFLMKESWFFFPLKYLLNRLGGIPVPSRKGAELTSAIASRFNGARYMNLAVTPEGTRSRNDKWRKGFLYIAYGAKVPLQLGVIDYRSKKIIIKEEYLPTGDIETDMRFVSRFYCDYADAALYPDKFAVSDLNQP